MCKLRCIYFRRVSDPRRVFLLAFRVTGSTGDKPGSVKYKPESTWEHLRAPATNLGAQATCLGAPRITVEQSGKNNIFLGNAAGAPGNHRYYLSFNDDQNSSIHFVFSSMYLSIYKATPVYMVTLDWLHALLGSNSRFTRK
jgi:hypothetical protein